MKTLRLDSLSHLRVLAVLLLAAAILPVFADARLKTIQVKVGAHPLKVEVADTDPARERGLMFRKQMGKNDGMLFIFEQPEYQSMWMKNTLIPLSVAFLDKEGRILSIHDMEPQTLDTHMSAGPALYAIETNKGWFAEKKVKVGDRVTGLPNAAR